MFLAKALVAKHDVGEERNLTNPTTVDSRRLFGKS